MEFCAGGDLAGYIHRCKRVPEVTACAVMRQLGAGLKELWSRHMVHVRMTAAVLCVLLGTKQYGLRNTSPGLLLMHSVLLSSSSALPGSGSGTGKTCHQALHILLRCKVIALYRNQNRRWL